MHDAIPAVAALGVSPLVRLADMQGWMVKRALDSGAHEQIKVPLVRTVEETKQLVLGAKFPPFPWGGEANDALVTIIQIETREAFESAEEIAKSVMGPELKEALARILAATRKAGKKCGIYCKDVQQAREFAAQGYGMLVAATDYTAPQAAVNRDVTSAKGEQVGKGTW
ncbi:hypothetical protein N0V84_011244 [Fusarium piperis]|uniref:HpcH/HpaI aldolase/citrate lyase domain-containing protein n=1 Tax=Fusarium piperis TaxID=1435070 RepID=A0A9W8TCH9_9HYPO|nr:hypothetical protein N0V84_011244 [Fusarium piperis]